MMRLGRSALTITVMLGIFTVFTVSGAASSDASGRVSHSATTVPRQSTFQAEIESVFKRLKYPDPAGISCVMPRAWTTGTTFYCSVPGVLLQGAPARVRATVTPSHVALALPLKASQQCSADSASVRVAVAAFQSQNPTVAVTEQLLLSKTDGGPWLTNWPHGAPNYTISVAPSGGVMFAIPSGSTPKPWSKSICLSVLTVFAQLTR
jgi:hypothetical protein